MTISSWKTFKKVNNPLVFTVQDSTTGVVYSIEATLRNNGYKKIIQERDFDYTPKEQAQKIAAVNSFNKVVYNIYNHPRGFSQLLEVYYK